MIQRTRRHIHHICSISIKIKRQKSNMNATKHYADQLDTNKDASMTAPAAERNKEAIFDVIKNYLQMTSARVLEVASGTGQHVTFFGKMLPHVTWQPSDRDDDYLRSISSYIAKNNLSNVNQPVHLDITEPLSTYSKLETDSFELVYNCNMIHISPWETSLGIFSYAGQLLKNDGVFLLYGPFRFNGVLTPESNVMFDERLRSQNPTWGIRDACDLEKLALKNGLKFEKMVDMPANNKCLIYRKCPAC